MPIYIIIGIIFVIVMGLLYVLVQKMKDGDEDSPLSMFFAIIIAALTICAFIGIPAAVLFGALWGITYALPNLIDVDQFKDLFSLSFLAIGLVVIVEIFFSGIFSGIVRHFKLPKPFVIVFKALVYTVLLYILSLNFFSGIQVTFLGALIVSIFIVLVETIVEDIYKKRKKTEEEIESKF